MIKFLWQGKKYNVIKLWRVRQLSLEGKIIYVPLLTLIPKSILEELNQK